ncbi:hypothetical protein SCHPADRAFT_946393 [Schizopora paradoxa]|uniref:Restriction of telomere capping protein 4 C-terminal domain-containing protein n=1 Tax=Schizopora paradoxa TaxID=27342 RepID=A0A0H2R2Q7_9AGAM|nr:hypothetical protein SCHPADRAFT_946393 [Schizopora paradoxa]
MTNAKCTLCQPNVSPERLSVKVPATARSGISISSIADENPNVPLKEFLGLDSNRGCLLNAYVAGEWVLHTATTIRSIEAGERLIYRARGVSIEECPMLEEEMSKRNESRQIGRRSTVRRMGEETVSPVKAELLHEQLHLNGLPNAHQDTLSSTTVHDRRSLQPFPLDVKVQKTETETFTHSTLHLHHRPTSGRDVTPGHSRTAHKAERKSRSSSSQLAKGKARVKMWPGEFSVYDIVKGFKTVEKLCQSRKYVRNFKNTDEARVEAIRTTFGPSVNIKRSWYFLKKGIAFGKKADKVLVKSFLRRRLSLTARWADLEKEIKDRRESLGDTGLDGSDSGADSDSSTTRSSTNYSSCLSECDDSDDGSSGSDSDSVNEDNNGLNASPPSPQARPRKRSRVSQSPLPKQDVSSQLPAAVDTQPLATLGDADPGLRNVSVPPPMPDQVDASDLNDSILDFSDSQCPCCRKALPSSQSEHLRHLLARVRVLVVAFDQESQSTQELNELGKLGAKLCKQHNLESLIPLARSNGWPTELDFYSIAIKIHEEVVPMLFFTLLNPLDNAFIQKVLAEVRTQPPKMRRGLNLEMKDMVDCSVITGYLGAGGRLLIEAILKAEFPESLLQRNGILDAVHPLSYHELVGRALVSEAAYCLILRDCQDNATPEEVLRMEDVDKAFSILNKSQEYGVAKFPVESTADVIDDFLEQFSLDVSRLPPHWVFPPEMVEKTASLTCANFGVTSVSGPAGPSRIPDTKTMPSTSTPPRTNIKREDDDDEDAIFREHLVLPLSSPIKGWSVDVKDGKAFYSLLSDEE